MQTDISGRVYGLNTCTALGIHSAINGQIRSGDV
jgi:hypothetical protein